MLNQISKGLGRAVRAAAVATVLVGGIASAQAQDITGAGAGNAVVCKIVPETYGSQGTLTVSNLTVNFNSL